MKPSSREPQELRTLGCCTLSDGSARRPLLMLQPDLLQGHEVLRQLAAPFEDCGIGTLGTRTPAAPATLRAHGPLASTLLFVPLLALCPSPFFSFH